LHCLQRDFGGGKTMQRRPKYPLTPEAKEAAKSLLEAWDNGEIQQSFYLIVQAIRDDEVRHLHLYPGTGARRSFQPPSLGVIRELGEYKLITLTHVVDSRQERFEVTLLQELRNAVSSNFDVSDFFLTTSAVGTIIYGDLVMDKGSIFQSAAAGIGDANNAIQYLPDQLIRLLGEDTLKSYPKIDTAIKELKSANERTRMEKAGKVIEELGRALGHLSNTGGALDAITLIARVLGGGGL
jgi:hypothetical protein